MGKILIVDDESNVLTSFEKMLVGQGHQVSTARRAKEAMQHLESDYPDLLIMDIKMPEMNGLEAYRQIKQTYSKLPVIIMTGFGTTESAIEATKLGAFDYLIKPFEPEEMMGIIDRALESVRVMQRQVELDPGKSLLSTDAIIGQSMAMREVYKAIGRVAQTDVTVLIRGETGTGKELVARAIYQHSLRNHLPLIVMNCVAIPETLLESELFGHEKGAFTGAIAKRIGKFEQGRGGTILLDEIGDIPLSIQAKILRVLEEKSFERVGSNETINVDIRLIAATNRNLENSISEGKFREDLFHRLNVVSIHLPPLRDRRDDIQQLADYFLERFSARHKINKPSLPPPAMELLSNHRWPGNVRELEHCIQRLIIFTRGYPIQVSDVQHALEYQQEIISSAAPKSLAAFEQQLKVLVKQFLEIHTGSTTWKQFLEINERSLLVSALQLTRGNQTKAAKILGLTRPTLQAKIHKYKIQWEANFGDN